jgi:XTP/dITP diphosphohydrolase
MFKELLIATGNKGKFKEITELVKPFGIKTFSPSDFGIIEEPEETGKTFKENSILKAKYYAEKANIPALADDSGLCVEALGGQPGIYSARWAGEGKDFSVGMKKIEKVMLEADAKDFSAYFICNLSVYIPSEKKSYSFEGRIDGVLQFPPKGENGFGYDPIFVPNGYEVTFGQMPSEEKHAISHRARAFEKFVMWMGEKR